jgi:tRNA threonylcarbamoyladenosine biosynthesis protein TsaE
MCKVMMLPVYFIPDEGSMEQFGASLLSAMEHSGIVFLQGNLGMGKTTLSRGLIRSGGHVGAVKSPTYTLVESYELTKGTVHHFDLYRLIDPEELEYLGIRDYFSEAHLCLVEWPDKGDGLLPKPDLDVFIEPHGEGRAIQCVAHTEKGQKAADIMNNTFSSLT